jgi:hypothetical protein
MSSSIASSIGEYWPSTIKMMVGGLRSPDIGMERNGKGRIRRVRLGIVSPLGQCRLRRC